MNITETPKGSITIVALNGSLDASTVAELQKSPALTNVSKSVVIDLEHIDFLDSSGLGALIGTLRKKREMKAETLLSCMNDKISQVFEITNAHRLFHIFDDTSAAVDYAKQMIERS
jgi:anti-sigma B factor antagonist